MLEWTTAGPGPRLGLLLHHDDAAREVAYDRTSTFGRLDRGLDEAPKRGWILVSMQRDWKRVFPRDRDGGGRPASLGAAPEARARGSGRSRPDVDSLGERAGAADPRVAALVAEGYAAAR